MVMLVQKSENCCHKDVHPKSQPQNVLKMFLVFQEIEPIVLINVFLYKKTECIGARCTFSQEYSCADMI